MHQMLIKVNISEENSDAEWLAALKKQKIKIYKFRNLALNSHIY